MAKTQLEIDLEAVMKRHGICVLVGVTLGVSDGQPLQNPKYVPPGRAATLDGIILGGNFLPRECLGEVSDLFAEAAGQYKDILVERGLIAPKRGDK